MVRHHFVLGVVLTALSGCIPYHYVGRPGITGTIVDQTTSHPVSGATVALNMHGYAGQVTSTTVAKTDDAGRFTIPAKRYWSVLIILGPVDFMSYYGTANVSAAGFCVFQRS